MKWTVPLTLVASAALLAGCATKKYVAQQVDPVSGKLDDVSKKQQSTQQQVDTNEQKLNATAEKADSADSRAGDALNRADAASKKADQVRLDLRNELSEKIANLDDYKSVGEATVLLSFNSDKLTPDAKQQLDQLTGGQLGSSKRYFIAIQGFTDKIGTPEYNLDLSRRRAQAVQTYLVGEKNVPVYRIQIVGLGEDKPLNDEKTRDDRAKNRRVQVSVFSADNATATSPGTAQ